MVKNVGEQMRPRRSAEVQWRSVGDELLILHLVLKQYHILNAVAARIWELSDGEHTADRITDRLAEEHAQDRQEICQDVIETLEGLKALQLVEFEDELS